MDTRFVTAQIVLGLAVAAVAQEPPPAFPASPVTAMGSIAETVPPRFGTVTGITADGRLKLQVVEFRERYDVVKGKASANGVTGDIHVTVVKKIPVVRQNSYKIDEVRVESLEGKRYAAKEFPQLFSHPTSVLYSHENERVDPVYLGLAKEDTLHLILPPDRGRFQDDFMEPFSEFSPPPPVPPEADNRP